MLSSQAFVEQIKHTISEVSVDELQQLLPQDPVIVDIREPGELSQGLISGAQHIPRGTLEMQLENLAKQRGVTLEELAECPIYLYCRSGARSALAAESLGRMGLHRIYSVAGGFMAWQQQNYATTSAE